MSDDKVQLKVLIKRAVYPALYHELEKTDDKTERLRNLATLGIAFESMMKDGSTVPSIVMTPSPKEAALLPEVITSGDSAEKAEPLKPFSESKVTVEKVTTEAVSVAKVETTKDDVLTKSDIGTDTIQEHRAIETSHVKQRKSNASVKIGNLGVKKL